jgi:7,8-dihydropterin-6-yl-methyl-4-(beta-D-ribofuranosyl)aminobenzene 5'-phosphate synthase
MRRHVTIFQTLSATGVLLILPLVRAQGSSGDEVESFRVEILSTMLADKGIGEWGFAALVEVDGERILFDTGRYPDTVLRNAKELGVDLSNVIDVILSHHHMDHVGGLLTLRCEFSKTNPSALSRVHVAHGISFPRRWGSDATEEDNPMIAIREAYEATGGVFIEHDRTVELMPDVWLTGQVPRVHAEQNWSGVGTIETSNGWEEDTIPESQSLIVNTSKGLAVVSGCGHAGIINIIDYASDAVADEPAFAVIGGTVTKSLCRSGRRRSCLRYPSSV